MICAYCTSLHYIEKELYLLLLLVTIPLGTCKECYNKPVYQGVRNMLLKLCQSQWEESIMHNNYASLERHWND